MTRTDKNIVAAIGNIFLGLAIGCAFYGKIEWVIIFLAMSHRGWLMTRVIYKDV